MTWRSETYAALEASGRAAGTRWPQYARFAQLQSRGLRREALSALAPFTESLAASDFAIRWAFAHFLYDSASAPHVVLSALAPHPLQQRVLLPTLKEALTHAEPPVDAWLWLATHHRFEAGPVVELLRDALMRRPGEPRLARRLAIELLERVAYAGHHLNESAYLGNAEDDLPLLTEARGLLSSDDPLLEEVAHEETILREWLDYVSAGRPGDFPAWCLQHGRAGPQPVATYSWRPASGGGSEET